MKREIKLVRYLIIFPLRVNARYILCKVNYVQVPAVIKSTIETYLAGGPVLLRVNKSHARYSAALQRLKIQCCTI